MRALVPSVLFCALAAPTLAQPLTTAFTYQGEIASNGVPYQGMFDVRFALFDAPTGGNQIGPELCAETLIAERGRITTTLDFGAQFNGAARYLQIRLREDSTHTIPCSDPNGYTLLEPRQPLTAAPNAAFALNSSSLDNQPASFYTNASNLSSGTLPDARLPANLPRLNTPNTFTATNQFNAFTGVNRTTAITGADIFGIQNPAGWNGYIGMYINSTDNAGGTPFYGFQSNNLLAWTQLDAQGRWSVFNGALALSATRTGNVGVGTDTPTTRLTVAGTTTSVDYLYTSPQTSYIMIPDTAFVGRDGVVARNTGLGGVYPAASSNEGLSAPVMLPHDAVITGFRVFCFDGSLSNDLQVSLISVNPASNAAPVTIRTVASSGATGRQTVDNGLLAPATVDNSARAYYVHAFGTNGWTTNDSLLIYAVRISYTVSRPNR